MSDTAQQSSKSTSSISNDPIIIEIQEKINSQDPITPVIPAVTEFQIQQIFSDKSSTRSIRSEIIGLNEPFNSMRSSNPIDRIVSTSGQGPTSLGYNPDFKLGVESRDHLDHDAVDLCFLNFPDTVANNERFIFYTKDLGVRRGFNFKDLGLIKDNSLIFNSIESKFWLDIAYPSVEELNALERGFGIHPLTIEDILAQNTREKCDVFPSYYFVVVKGFDDEKESSGTIMPLSVSILVFSNCVLSFHFSESKYNDDVLNRLQHKRRMSTLITADYICYSLIDEIVDTFQPLIRYIDHDTSSIDDLVSVLKASDQADMLKRISTSRKRVSMVGRLINYKPELIRVVLSRMKAQSSDILFYLEDIYDHAVTMKLDLQQFETSLSRAHSNYLAQISIEINELSNKSNNLATKITTVASIFLPMQVITGMWGMNVSVPGQVDGGSLTWFIGIVISMIVASSIGAYYLGRYLDK